MSGPVLVDVLAVRAYLDDPATWERALDRELTRSKRLRFWVVTLVIALASSISTGFIRAVEHGQEAAELRARCVESVR